MHDGKQHSLNSYVCYNGLVVLKFCHVIFCTLFCFLLPVISIFCISFLVSPISILSHCIYDKSKWSGSFCGTLVAPRGLLCLNTGSGNQAKIVGSHWSTTLFYLKRTKQFHCDAARKCDFICKLVFCIQKRHDAYRYSVRVCCVEH